MIDITSAQDLDALWSAPATILFKHSTQCDISATAYREMAAAAKQAPGMEIHLVRVIESRPVSQEIERRTGVRHESPQVFVLRNGAVSWHASHRHITAEAVVQQFQAAAAN